MANFYTMLLSRNEDSMDLPTEMR